MKNQADCTRENAIYETVTEENQQKSAESGSQGDDTSSDSDDIKSISNSDPVATESPVKAQKEFNINGEDQSQQSSGLSQKEKDQKQKNGSTQSFENTTWQMQMQESMISKDKNNIRNNATGQRLSISSDMRSQIDIDERLKRFQSFVKLKADMFKLTSQTSLNQESHNENKFKNSKNKIHDLIVYFGDHDQQSLNVNKKLQNKVRTQRYTILTWAPYSLFFQFTRIANIYFLIISVLTCFQFSPKDPSSMIGTFLLVLVFTMLKEAYEDYQRYKQDKEVNNKLAYVLDPISLQFQNKKWEDIEVGNIVKFLKDQEAPADIAVLISSSESGVVNVDTMNLDGETNLKEKQALLENISEKDLQVLQGQLKCDLPNENLDKWEGKFKFEYGELKAPQASIKNLLLRGCYVRNTNFGIGVVVYTGMKTKIMKNLKKPPHKVSNMLKLMNKMLYSVFAFQIILIALYAGLNLNWITNEGSEHYYLNIDQSQNQAGRYFIQLLVYWVAYSHMIPISLYVIIEVLKLGVATFISKDIMMYDQETKTFAKCRNSDLIEELGQVEMVFSDKTGTLTQNKMIFKKCQINGIRYGDLFKDEEENKDGMAVSGIKEIRQFFKDEIKEKQELGSKAPYPYVTEFLQNLALCNTVICESNKQKKEEPYKASSPDELALVKAARNFGIQLVSRQHKKVTLFNMISREVSNFKLIAEFPFDSVRKRMSVILKDQNGNYSILCKGADSVMLNRITYEKNGIQGIKDIIEEDLYTFSCEGLRTLIMTRRSINKEEYQNFKSIYQQIQESSSASKETKLAQLYDTMEQQLRYLGCTAIEDKLQEGVPITIKKLLEADIRFFMLTGDKLETAIEIGKSCQVIQDNMRVEIIGKPIRENILKRLNRLISILNIDPSYQVKSLQDVAIENQVITVEGSCLSLILEDERLAHLFFHIAIRSKSVVCCRMSPKQKADVVNLFKSRGTWITLAIGDGANDVSMIMEAHIGVGIMGKEGTQAVRSADFSISQFHFLLRLILLHGRNGYLRVSQMICYYFYKNIVLVFTELYFAFYNGFSGQIFFLDWLPMLYNAFFTSWHCLFSQFLEKDINEHYSYKYPVIYKAGQLGLYFNYKIFWKWILLSIWHGVVCFYAPLIVLYHLFNFNLLIQTGITSTIADESGQRGDHWLHSTISFTIIIHLVFYKLLLETRHFNVITFFTGIGSMMLYYGVVLLSQIPQISYVFQPQILGLVNRMVLYPQFWLMIIAVPFVCLIPDFFIKLASKIFYPTPVDKVLMEQKEDPFFDFEDTLKDLDERQIEEKIRIYTEQEMRKKSVLEIKKTIQEIGYTDPGYHKQASHVNLSHLKSLKSQKSREESKRQNSRDSSKGRQFLEFDEDQQISHKYYSKPEYEKTIPEVDEDELTDNDEDLEDSIDSSGPEDLHTNIGGKDQDKPDDDNRDDNKDNDDNNSPDNSKSSRSVDQSFRSNRGLLKKQSGKNVAEIRDSKKSEKRMDPISVKRQKSKADSEHLQQPVTGRSKKSQKIKEDIVNNSLFSVSDHSRMDLMNDKAAPNEDNKRVEQQYLDYFEDLNKEVVEKQMNLKSPKKKASQKQQDVGSSNTIPLEQRKSISANEKQVKNYNKKKFQDKERRSKRLSQQDINIEEDESNGGQEFKEIKMNKPHSTIYDDQNQDKAMLQVESFHAQQDRPLTSNRISKAPFKQIFGKRSQDLLMINSHSEIPKSKIIRPHQIVDKISIKTAAVYDNTQMSISPTPSPITYMLGGHPLEQSCIPSIFTGEDDLKTNRQHKQSSRKKIKKYLAKYSSNASNHNTSNNVSHIQD